MTTMETAEHAIRTGGPHGDVRLTNSERKAIADELDRLRSEVTELRAKLAPPPAPKRPSLKLSKFERELAEGKRQLIGREGAGALISAIIAYRARTGASLYDSKNVVQKHMETHPAAAPSPNRTDD